MPVLLFEPRFHAAVRSGAKCQTIRGYRKRPLRHGQWLGLRGWEGVPYRSRQLYLATAILSTVNAVRIDRAPRGLAVDINGLRLDKIRTAALAVADGFTEGGVGEMRDYWETRRELPFEGLLIRWVPLDT